MPRLFPSPFRLPFLRRRPRSVAALLLTLLALASGYALCRGRIVRVHDGDTVSVLAASGELTRIRLYGVDAPETRQPGGGEAARFVSQQAFLEQATVQITDRDQYGRAVALLWLPDGRLLNEELVRAGHAWVYRDYCRLPLCRRWLDMEREAKQARRGLWRDARPQAPWLWRRQHRKSARRQG